tara:strand:- start:15718 stop:16410 length:693 start_codon:yes stop_codon:yes gene_type:complete
MKTVAFILARGGSKRIPNKNIKEFCGEPMISWAIRAARESNCFDEIIVSTDSKEIASISVSLGAEVNDLRSSELSNDYTTSIEVMANEASILENIVKYVCFLYASSPLIQAKTLKKAFTELKEDSSLDYVFPVARFAHPPERGFSIDKKKKIQPINSKNFHKRTQDLDAYYHDSGQFYFGKPEAFKELKPIFSNRSKAIVLSRIEVCDIDEEEDWSMAEILFKNLRNDKQ